MSTDAPDIAEYYHEYKVTVYNNVFAGIACGAYIVVYVKAVYYVLLSKPGFTSSSPRMFMFGITTFTFVLGIIELVLYLSLGFQQAQLFLNPSASNVWSSYHANVVDAVGATIARLMYILSDIICAWRAVVLWNRDKRVIAILLLFILGTIVAAGYDLGLNLATVFGPHPQDEGYVRWGERDLIMGGPTLATNLLSTGLIAWKAWQRRISVGKHLCEGGGSVRVDRVFALLIESGFIYCCIWILYLISTFGVLPQPDFIVIVFISSLYPTLIIVLVGMQMSPVEHYSTHPIRTQFAPGPAPGPPKDTSMPGHVFTIHREYVSDSDTQIPAMMVMKTSDEERASGCDLWSAR